jgi:hypothetical protein
MPMPSRSVVGHAFGAVHRFWMTRPIQAAALAFAWYLIVVIAAGALGILHRHIHADAVYCTPAIPGAPPTGSPITADGFTVANWGILYFFGMPLCAFLMGYYLRLLDNALLTLDDVIKPAGSGEEQRESFTQFLVQRIRLHWSSWVFPLSLAAPIILALVADGRDIIAPLQSQGLPPSCSSDWSVVGYMTSGHPAALWYLAFNLAAWAMQVFLGYCGVLVLALTGAVLGTVFRYGLGGQRVVDAFRPPAALPVPDRYYPDWKYCLPRCGLDALDIVFLTFVGLNLFALVTSATSIFVNVYWRGGPTPGSFILAIGTMFFIPLSVFCVFVPYFGHFPEDFPKNFVPPCNPCEKPNPWPLKSEKISWFLIGVTTSFWLALLYVILKAVFPGFMGKS